MDVHSRRRRIGVPLAMAIAVVLVPVAGFATAGIVMGLLLMLCAEHERRTGRSWAMLAVGVAVIILIFTLIFREALSVPLPTGALF